MMILDIIIFNDSNNDNSHNDLIKPILFYGNLHVLLVGKNYSEEIIISTPSRLQDE